MTRKQKCNQRRAERRQRAAERAAAGLPKLEPWRRSVLKKGEIYSTMQLEVAEKGQQARARRDKARNPELVWRERDHRSERSKRSVRHVELPVNSEAPCCR